MCKVHTVHKVNSISVKVSNFLPEFVPAEILITEKQIFCWKAGKDFSRNSFSEYPASGGEFREFLAKKN